MPHLIIEHSTDVAQTHDIDALCQALFDTAMASDLFATKSAIKVRALACPHWRTATTPQSFAHVTVRVLQGRSVETRAEISALILAALDTALPDIGALSVEVCELEQATYAKRVLPEMETTHG